jgi:dTDP-4-dehydrorhamnose reductase
MRILVLGSNGQLGKCFHDQLNKTKYIVTYSSRSEIDLSNIDLLETQIEAIKPNIIINAAAYTAVDKAESEPEKADLINHIAVANIAKKCSEINACLIHISTDYVFDGMSDHPYLENSKTNPRCVYGQSKLNGEQAIISSKCKYVIVRTAWVFSEHGDNFLKTMLKLGVRNNELSIVDDQKGCPTYAQDIAKSIVIALPKIISNQHIAEVFHYCGDESCTWFEFAKSIFLEAGKKGITTPNIIKPIKTLDYPTPAIRPHYSVLECNKIVKFFGVSVSNWREGTVSAITHLNGINDSI